MPLRINFSSRFNDRKHPLENYSHYFKFINCNLVGKYCCICQAEVVEISFIYNSEIFLICTLCSLEFLRITFQKLDPYSYRKKDNKRTTLVYIFFKENIFLKKFNPDYKEKKKIFKNPLRNTLKKLSRERKFQELSNLSVRRLR